MPGRILVRAPNWVGDVVMATPALRALRRAHPGAEIVLEGRPVLEGLVSGLESLDGFLPDRGRGAAAALGRVHGLRSRSFDWAVLLPDSARAALGPFLAGIRVRAGYARDLARRALLTLALDPPERDGEREPISMIERYLRITRALGCPDQGEKLEVSIRGEARDTLEARLRSAGVGASDRLLAVAPGAGFGSSKLWPAEHFARACDEIATEFDLRTTIAPGPGEERIADAIVAAMKTEPLNLSEPCASLAELAALLERSTLLLTNDTGPRQIALALDRPVITVMGPTDPRHTQHLLERQRVLREEVPCSPCHLKTCPIDHRCMRDLAPARAVGAARELLS